jgi:hypothetical protein
MAEGAPLRVTPQHAFRYRARVTHLDRKLSLEAIAEAAWGGLQDSAPRAAITGIHARVEDADPDSWEHPALVQIWFRGGADYVVPRADAGIFTLGTYPRDPERAAAIERLTDAVHEVTGGATTRISELPDALRAHRATTLRHTAMSGRVHIRWNASDIWIIPVERPDIDVEEARMALARRFFHWFGPATMKDLARWTGVTPREARIVAEAIRHELTPVEVEDTEPAARWVLTEDLGELQSGQPITGVRLLPWDDPCTRLDRTLLVPDPALRRLVLPGVGESPGYIPGALLVDGEVRGAWRRQAGRVVLDPFGVLTADEREAAEREARGLPIPGGIASVSWA